MAVLMVRVVASDFCAAGTAEQCGIMSGAKLLLEGTSYFDGTGLG